MKENLKIVILILLALNLARTHFNSPFSSNDWLNNFRKLSNPAADIIEKKNKKGLGKIVGIISYYSTDFLAFVLFIVLLFDF